MKKEILIGFIIGIIANISGSYLYIYFFSESDATAVTLPVDFENATLSYSITPFGEAATAIVENPSKKGINPSSTVVEFEKQVNAETWAGATLQLDDNIDFSTTQKFSVKVWSPKEGVNVLLKVENSADGGINKEVQVKTTKTGQWEELIFDFSGIDTSKEYGKVIMFLDFGAVGDGTVYYYDDIHLIN